VDNTAPEVHITRPADSDIIVEDTSVAPVTSLIVGNVTFQATATDNLSGIQSAKWQVDGTDVTPATWVGDPKNNYSYTYTGFETGNVLNEHSITFMATDR